MKVYPYRCGEYCSILEAVDRRDAADWLRSCVGEAVFCEIDVEQRDLYGMYGAGLKERVQDFLRTHENFTTDREDHE